MVIKNKIKIKKSVGFFGKKIFKKRYLMNQNKYNK